MRKVYWVVEQFNNIMCVTTNIKILKHFTEANCEEDSHSTTPHCIIICVLRIKFSYYTLQVIGCKSAVIFLSGCN